MSYAILYRAMFVKLSDGTFIPITESGDNNVWDVDRNRRSRSWSNERWLHRTDEQRKRYSLTQQEILCSIQQQIQDTITRYAGQQPSYAKEPYTEELILKELSYFTAVTVYGHSVTSAAQYLGFFKSGFRHAVTMEEAGGVRLSWCEVSEDGKSSKYHTDHARNEKELADKWAEHLSQGRTPWIGFSEYSGESAWQAMKTRTAKPRAERQTPTEQHIVAFSYQCCERYMTKLTSRKIFFNPFKDDAHKFSSRKIAENAMERIVKRFPQFSNVRVETISVP